MPGVSVPGKLLLAQISEDLAILMLGVIGYQEPIFSMTDMKKTNTQIDAVGPGTFQVCHPSVHLRIAFHKQAAFWAFAFLVSQMTSQRSPVGSARGLGPLDHQNILRILEFFKNDHGKEVATGYPVFLPTRLPGPDLHLGLDTSLILSVNYINVLLEAIVIRFLVDSGSGV
ncbi:hypothetical protein B0H16DRAFT_1469548 [Mycena metata]|uniref:Uncharacterized protein n=1 Tax=Mycena metata TaxID=1033252 RepID=A0AAD7HXC9_9AGAR|nr:hypothetical protein B0H16DRAFT_1469548 [Mycena metata]